MTTPADDEAILDSIADMVEAYHDARYDRVGEILAVIAPTNDDLFVVACALAAVLVEALAPCCDDPTHGIVVEVEHDPHIAPDRRDRAHRTGAFIAAAGNGDHAGAAAVLFENPRSSGETMSDLLRMVHANAYGIRPDDPTPT